MKSPVAIATAAALLGGVPQALSEIVPLLQSRSIFSSASVLTPGQNDFATDTSAALAFEPFVEDVISLAVVQGTSGAEAAVAVASGSQNSIIGSHSVSASGQAGVNVTLLPAEVGISIGGGSSYFDFAFEVTTASVFSLIGSVDFEITTGGGANLPDVRNKVYLEDIGTSTLLFETTSLDEAFAFGGALEPGLYRLVASAEANASQAAAISASYTAFGIGSYDFNFQLTDIVIPEPATTAAGLAAALACGISWARRRYGAAAR
jgi:hypothetical protein